MLLGLCTRNLTVFLRMFRLRADMLLEFRRKGENGKVRKHRKHTWRSKAKHTSSCSVLATTNQVLFLTSHPRPYADPRVHKHPIQHHTCRQATTTSYAEAQKSAHHPLAGVTPPEALRPTLLPPLRADSKPPTERAATHDDAPCQVAGQRLESRNALAGASPTTTPTAPLGEIHGAGRP